VSLRRRLLIGIVVLLAVAIGITDAVTYSSLRSFLLGRLDEQTDVAQHQVFVAVRAAYHRALVAGSQEARTDPEAWLAQLVGGASTGAPCPSAVASTRPEATRALFPDPADVIVGRVSPDVFVEILAPDHQILFSRPSGTCDPRPALPASMPVQAVPVDRRFGASQGAFFPNQTSFTTAAVGSSTRYRAEAVQIPGGILVTAVALTPDDQTLASVVHIELVTSIAVVIAAIVVALLVTRLGLRPLDEMTATAGAIAGGELGRRIRTTDVRSEVGRLGHALNGMLTQIEAAFAQQRRSEGRLRRFVADASHELRTPLTSVRGYAELLRKGALSDDAARRQAAARIEAEAARMGVLVDDLLLLARLDQGRPLERVPVDLASVVGDAVADATVSRRDHPVQHESGGPVLVLGDAVRLRQVVDNLLTNALEHTPAGTPVEVTLEERGPWAVLTVADRGPGLDGTQAAQVFEPFYRAATARTGGGAGLGLAIVAGLVEAHGGRAVVHTSPGQGCRFEVTLPVAPARTDLGPAGPAPASPAERGRAAEASSAPNGVGMDPER
jgi:two-component system OmpR family sensor kinase